MATSVPISIGFMTIWQQQQQQNFAHPPSNYQTRPLGLQPQQQQLQQQIRYIPSPQQQQQQQQPQQRLSVTTPTQPRPLQRLQQVVYRQVIQQQPGKLQFAQQQQVYHQQPQATQQQQQITSPQQPALQPARDVPAPQNAAPPLVNGVMGGEHSRLQHNQSGLGKHRSFSVSGTAPPPSAAGSQPEEDRRRSIAVVSGSQAQQQNPGSASQGPGLKRQSSVFGFIKRAREHSQSRAMDQQQQQQQQQPQAQHHLPPEREATPGGTGA
ncbi:adenylate cyclase, terminal-differentiation specific-like, partial [Schistocerca cancellata]|uniref:adenylate cyclase, terminal-differentiation specific-like n=1 Tax=Schistocerca cancellata TaxID=274614 RepID=UPI0021197CD1